MEHMKLISVQWYSRLNTIGVALFCDDNRNEYQARMDVIPNGADVKVSIEHIRDHGIPLSYEVAKAHFPSDLDPVMKGYDMKYKSP